MKRVLVGIVTSAAVVVASIMLVPGKAYGFAPSETLSDSASAPASSAATSTAPEVTILAGTQTTLGTEGRGPVRPFARVGVDWTVAGTARPVVMFAEADLTGLPDAQMRLDQPSDFDAIEMEVGATWRPSMRVRASLYCEAGFASRIQTADHRPVESAPLWTSCGVAFRERGGHAGRLRVGAGPDERPGWGPVLAAHVKGSVRLASYGNVGMTLAVRAVLGLQMNPYGRRTNVITVGVAAGWGG